jgi:hypothetical protein
MTQEQQQPPGQQIKSSKEEYLTAWLFNWWQTAVLLDPTINSADWVMTTATMLRMLTESSSKDDESFAKNADLVVGLVKDELHGPREIIRD